MQPTDKQTAADRPYAKILKAKTPRCAALDFIVLSLLQRAFCHTPFTSRKARDSIDPRRS
ncbi:MAG TPA: hypothetical protein VGO49_17820 [Bradyrhizobium sp.]|jgi:hypothetical protein|nr:hypothetical protein [Bradyrhizobium sp.]